VQQQVASGRLAYPGCSLSCQAERRPITHSRGKRDLTSGGACDGTSAPAGWAGPVRLLSRTTTCWTSHRGVQGERADRALMGLCKAEVHGRLNIRSAHGKAGAGTGAGSGAKQHLKEVTEAPRAAPAPEQATEINAPALPAGWRGKLCARFPVCAKLVIALALVRIRKDVIGFAHLLELLFRGGVARVDIGMILPRQPTIGFFDLVRCRRAGDPEDGIVVAELCGHSVWLLLLNLPSGCARIRYTVQHSNGSRALPVRGAKMMPKPTSASNAPCRQTHTLTRGTRALHRSVSIDHGSELSRT
jgi:hypothetical protein